MRLQPFACSILVLTQFVASETSTNDDAIPVYYINLARRPDREEHIRSEFQRHGLALPHFEINRFEAVDGLTHTFTDDENQLFKTFDETVGKTSPHNTALLKANSLSHMGVWKLVLESGVPFAIVFQDDVQLGDGFVQGVQEVLKNNPSDALVTWIGINYFASGRVSRSAPLQAGVYDADQFSKVIQGTNEKVGVARKNLVSTNSLAYIITQRGAKALLQHFGKDDVGWKHHTDHAMVEFLDEQDLSYISRKILATTHDDGVLGSDIFTGETQQERDVKSAHQTVLKALRFARLPLQQAVAAATTGKPNGEDPDANSASTEPWMKGLKLVCEEMQCLFPDCPGPLVTYAILSWDLGGETTCSSDTVEEGSCQDAAAVGVDSIGVRRDMGRKRLMLGVAAADVTPQVAAKVIPAWWTLEAWSTGKHEYPIVPRPRFGVGEVVEVNLSDADQWERSEVVAIGYHDPSWGKGVVTTYVVKHHDGRLLTVPIDDPAKIQKG